MHSKGTALTIALLMVLSLVLAACGTATPAPAVVTAPTTAPAVVEPTAAPAGPVRGGTLRHALAAITTFDPAFMSTAQDDQIGRYWTDGFIWVNGDNEVDWDRSLATGVKISDDGKVWTFTVRDGVKFHDGRAFTSADVKGTFDRLRDPAVGSPVAKLYANIASIDAPDAVTVVFTLAKTNPDFLTADLNDYHARIMDVSTKDYMTTWNGTGPFIVKQYIPEDRVVMERNPNYWRMGADGKSLPYLDGLEFLFLNDATAQYEALRGGQVDWINYLAPEVVGPIKENPDLHLFGRPTNMHYVIRMRSDKGPASNPLVREALRLATDRQAILDLAALGQGAVGNDTPIGPAFGSFYLDTIPQRDVAAAKAKLTEAGYPNGLTIDLITQDVEVVRNIATVWAEQLAEAGVTVNIKVTPIGVYYGGDNLWMEADFAITDWGTRGSPQPYLDLAYTCKAEWNESHFCDAELDALAAKTASEIDTGVRAGLFHDVARIFQARGPIIVPYYSMVYLAYGDAVKPGLESESLPTLVDLAGVWLER